MLNCDILVVLCHIYCTVVDGKDGERKGEGKGEKRGGGLGKVTGRNLEKEG
jgi:hypothetical protein